MKMSMGREQTEKATHLKTLVISNGKEIITQRVGTRDCGKNSRIV